MTLKGQSLLMMGIAVFDLYTPIYIYLFNVSVTRGQKVISSLKRTELLL